MSDTLRASLFKDIEKHIVENFTDGEKNKKKSFKFLFKARSPQDLSKFHECCDNKGPTVTILYGRYNTIFGGYTSQDWKNGTNRFQSDENAFLFYTKESAKCSIITLSEGRKDYAITYDSTLGPTFGGGTTYWRPYDFQAFTLSEKNKSEMKDGFLHLNGSFNPGCSFQKVKKEDINGGKMDVKMLEIFQVVDDILDTPWRNIPDDGKVRQLKEDLEKFEPPYSNTPFYNILLLGVIGSGKSSFFNTVATTFAGKVNSPAIAADAPTSVTNKIHHYEILSKDDRPLKFRIIDIRGLGEDHDMNNELEHLLNGELPNDYRFPDQPDKVQPNILVNYPTLNDEIHLVCFVTDIVKLEVQNDNAALSAIVSSAKRCVYKKGLPMVALATKFDQLCPRILENANHLYSSPKAKTAVENVARALGLPKKHVFPIVNNVHDTQVDKNKDKLVLQALSEMVAIATDYLQPLKDRAIKKNTLVDRKLKLMREPIDQRRMEMQKELFLHSEAKMRILCVGSVQSGKSSLIDSILSALTGEITNKATAGFTSEETLSVSTTTKFQLHPVRYKTADDKITKSSVVLADVPGLQETGGVKIKHLYYIIGGHVPDKFKIIDGIDEESKKYRKKTKIEKRIHCVCFVFDVQCIDTLSETVQKDLNAFLSLISDEGIPYVVALTKIDKLGNTVKEDALRLFDDKFVEQNVEKVAKQFGIKESKIYPVTNYVNEIQTNHGTDVLLYDLFREIHKLCKNYLEDFEEEDSDGNEDDENEDT